MLFSFFSLRLQKSQYWTRRRLRRSSFQKLRALLVLVSPPILIIGLEESQGAMTVVCIKTFLHPH